MSIKPLRDYTALTIDGGGIKGYIVATALIDLERELGGKRLIEVPQIKVLAGTSTGAIIAAAIALGMSASDIADFYKNLGQQVFPPRLGPWLATHFPTLEKDVDKLAEGELLAKTALYSNDNLIAFVKKTIADITGNPDFTLHDLSEQLPPDKQLIITTMNILERRTHFLRSNDPKCGDWPLWKAIVASSSEPLALPVIEHTAADGTLAYYVDGGVGSYGNPSYFAVRELINTHQRTPDQVSLLSFGTGWVNAANYAAANGAPSSWHVLKWAMNAPFVLVSDAARAQSLDILDDFGDELGERPEGLDFRRFQFDINPDVNSDAYTDAATYTRMRGLGELLGKRVADNVYAPSANPEIDPERLFDGYDTRLNLKARKI